MNAAVDTWGEREKDLIGTGERRLQRVATDDGDWV
jgi:hypothetical protein